MFSAVRDISARIKDFGATFDVSLQRVLVSADGVPPELSECMRYSMHAPGKRLRPFLVQRCHELCGGAAGRAEYVSVAVECAHVFTLIHDDLPCMDDAETRRGLAANHRVYGEAFAVLGGDALLALSLELLTRAGLEPPTTVALVRELSDAIGWAGVIGGQVSDILSETQDVDAAAVQSIHQRKTARLMQSCCRLGALAADADDRFFNNLSEYGLHLGLAFQIADDLLDITAESSDTGKPAGSDVRNDKKSLPAVVGIDRSRQLARDHADQACGALASFGAAAQDLRELAEYVICRTH